MTANPLLDRRNAKPAATGGREAIYAHVDYLNSLKTGLRWRAIENDGKLTIDTVKADRKPVEAVKPYVPVITKKLDW
ncbi:hypothetical protein UFOVP319_50 [uncultured Caudovirales phage]|uniref:Uncharacterized protein n=1 Tax=uncultured Caudovirales phage TaxID=2100421 RepID=A0A6J5LU40_9CAUD|nr:hypothetical protein UFOVP319_50 [uncultured Caudovirales phage]